jgi:hypothetical protein
MEPTESQECKLQEAQTNRGRENVKGSYPFPLMSKGRERSREKDQDHAHKRSTSVAINEKGGYF